MYANAARLAVAAALLWIVFFGLDAQEKNPPPSVPTPAEMLRDKISPVSRALRDASAYDRALWAEVWEKSAKVVEGDEGSDAIFTDTRSLRAFTVITLDIAWHRIAGNSPGKYDGLREAVEAFLGNADVLGKDDVPMTLEIRERYIKAAHALAWAGVNRG